MKEKTKGGLDKSIYFDTAYPVVREFWQDFGHLPTVMSATLGFAGGRYAVNVSLLGTAERSWIPDEYESLKVVVKILENNND